MLRHGEISVEGRLVDASNATLFCEICHDGRDRRTLRLQAGGGGAAAVGLPRRHAGRPRGRGLHRCRRPPAGASCHRPCCATGRSGRAWCSCGSTPSRAPSGRPADPRCSSTCCRRGPSRTGGFACWTPSATTASRWCSAHADDDRLRRMAVLDVVLNNADRKGGHVLVEPGGSVHGVDHGVSFHTEPKLRTVLWGWAGDPLRARRGRGPGAAAGRPAGRPGHPAGRPGVPPRGARLPPSRRPAAAEGRLPFPVEGWPAIPWPPF